MRSSTLFVGFAALSLTACTIQAAQVETGSTMSAEFQVASSATSSLVSAAAISADSAPSIPERMLSGGILDIGNASAPVSLTLFINHRSPYSETFVQSLLPQLNTDFITTGQLHVGIVPISFHKYPQSSDDAALFLCAAWQGKGQLMNDQLLQEPLDSALQKQLATLGFDVNTFAACQKSEKLARAIESGATLAQSLGITLVPSYVINGTKYVGLPDYADLRGQIQQAMR